MINKNKFILLILSLFFVSFRATIPVVRVPKDTRKLSEIKDLEKRLILVESDGNPLALSWAQARGLYQITPVAVYWHNKRNGTKYKPQDVYDPTIGRELYVSLIDHLEKQYQKESRLNRIVKVINSYNMGLSNTEAGNFNHAYLKKIIPNSYEKFMAGKK